MARRLKLRISRVFPSFQSCRSTKPSSLPESPVPASEFRRVCLSPVNPKVIDIDFPVICSDIPAVSQDFPAVYERPRPRSLRQQISRAAVSVSCGCRSSRSDRPFSPENCYPGSSRSEYRWKKEEKWHVVAKVQEEKARIKISGHFSSNDLCPPPASPATPSPVNSCFRLQEIKVRKKRRNPKMSSKKHRPSTSSADSGWFSSEDDETEALFSSKSLSSDSSDLSHLHSIQESPISSVRRRKSHRRKALSKRSHRRKRPVLKASDFPAVLQEFGAGNETESDFPSKNSSFRREDETESDFPVKTSDFRREGDETESDYPAKNSDFRQELPANVAGKVGQSFAVVKRSDDPYGDFRNSMVEMILEKQMFDAKDLEQLLHCFLSLNAPRHHAIIVKVFSEIWEALFCNPREQIDEPDRPRYGGRGDLGRPVPACG
ncbi:hypothetical protein AMTRI_Chr13g125620 [Amborella trichopoda]